MALAQLRTLLRPGWPGAIPADESASRPRTAKRQKAIQAAMAAATPYLCRICDLIEPDEADELRRAMYSGELVGPILERLFVKYKLPRSVSA